MTPMTWKFRPSSASVATADARLTMWDQKISPAQRHLLGALLSTNHYPLTSSPVPSSPARTLTAAKCPCWARSPGTSVHRVSERTPGSARAPEGQTGAGCRRPERPRPIHPPAPPQAPRSRSSRFPFHPDATSDRRHLPLTPATSHPSTETAPHRLPGVLPHPTYTPPTVHPAKTRHPVLAPVRSGW